MTLENYQANHRAFVTAGGVARAYRSTKSDQRALDPVRLPETKRTFCIVTLNLLVESTGGTALHAPPSHFFNLARYDVVASARFQSQSRERKTRPRGRKSNPLLVSWLQPLSPAVPPTEKAS
jgi:hypothetical protein